MYKKTVYRAVLAFALMASVIFGVFMTLSIAESADKAITDINAYSADKVKYFNLISWLYSACLVGFVCFTFMFKSKLSKGMKVKTAAYRNVCVLGGCAFGATTLFTVVAEIAAALSSGYTPELGGVDAFYMIVKYTYNGAIVNMPYLALTVGFAVSAAYFFYCAASKEDKHSNLFAGLSMLPALTLAGKLIMDFLMQNSNGYGQLYNYHLLSVGFILLFFVNETRFYLRTAAPALYVFFGLSAIMSTAIFVIPVITLSVTGVVKTGNANLMFCIADLALAVYIALRLFSLNIKVPKAVKEGVDVEDFEVFEDAEDEKTDALEGENEYAEIK